MQHLVLHGPCQPQRDSPLSSLELDLAWGPESSSFYVLHPLPGKGFYEVLAVGARRARGSNKFSSVRGGRLSEGARGAGVQELLTYLLVGSCGFASDHCAGGGRIRISGLSGPGACGSVVWRMRLWGHRGED